MLSDILILLRIADDAEAQDTNSTIKTRNSCIWGQEEASPEEVQAGVKKVKQQCCSSESEKLQDKADDLASKQLKT